MLFWEGYITLQLIEWDTLGILGIRVVMWCGHTIGGFKSFIIWMLRGKKVLDGEQTCVLTTLPPTKPILWYYRRRMAYVCPDNGVIDYRTMLEKVQGSNQPFIHFCFNCMDFLISKALGRNLIYHWYGSQTHACEFAIAMIDFFALVKTDVGRENWNFARTVKTRKLEGTSLQTFLVLISLHFGKK